jgi:6-phosphofructokinase 1
MTRVALITSGGDCQGLNAAIRGIGKSLFEKLDNVEIFGMYDGYRGLIERDYKYMEPKDFSGILTQGGTILGTSRQRYVPGKDIVDDEGNSVIPAMLDTYNRLNLDCLVIMGGNGTQKSAKLIADAGMNVVTLPKTIDNDIYGTDFTFGFHTACEIATDVIDRLHTTAASHGRVIVVEIMGNKAGWLTLYSGMAGGADAILLPEIPYDIEKVAEVMESRARNNKAFSIIAVAEGAMDKKEAKLKRKEREAARKDAGFHGIAYRIAEQLQELAGVEARAVVPGHIQRGGTPCAYDRVLSTQFGVHAADLIKKDKYGYTVALVGNEIVHNKLSEVAGISKLVPEDHQMVDLARNIGISFGD